MYATCRRGWRSAAVLLVSAVLAGCDIAVDGHGGFDFGVAAGRASDEWRRSYAIEPGGRVVIININGRIAAEAAAGTSVEVLAERTAKAATDEDARALLAALEMREEVGAGTVRVEVRSPRRFGSGGHEIKWRLKIPRGVAVDLRTVNGGVTLDGLDGEVRARSTNGGITGGRLAATSVDAAVTNGGIEIGLTRPVTAGTFELDAVNGGVSLTLPAESKAQISGRAVNGGVTVSDLALETAGEQSRRRVEGTLNGGGARILLETVNGGVRVGRAHVSGE